MALKICKDGRIWGQNNKEAGNHLGVSTGHKSYVKKGFNTEAVKTHRRGKGRPFEKGHIDSDETKIKKSISHIGELNSQYGKRGKESAGWKGGITPLIDSIRDLTEYHQWRSDVYKRDYWTCQTCHKKGGGIEIHAHHIKSLALMIRENDITNVIEAQLCKELWDVDNGVTLCEDCHILTNNYGHTLKEREVV